MLVFLFIATSVGGCLMCSRGSLADREILSADQFEDLKTRLLSASSPEAVEEIEAPALRESTGYGRVKHLTDTSGRQPLCGAAANEPASYAKHEIDWRPERDRHGFCTRCIAEAEKRRQSRQA